MENILQQQRRKKNGKSTCLLLLPLNTLLKLQQMDFVLTAFILFIHLKIKWEKPRQKSYSA
jgi:hypothetical protein